MAVLKKATRDKLPDSTFLGPGRTFPGNDPEHLRKAIQLAPRSEAAGNITAEQRAAIQAKARARLGRYKSSVERG